MSNQELAVFNGTVPAHIRQGNSGLMKALAGEPQGKRLSIKGGVFRLIVGGKQIGEIEDRKLPVVIVNAAPKVARTFYQGKYVDDQAVAPACWSADGLKPDATVPSPQSNMCATCPQNVKGSGDGDARACRFSQRIAVVLANDMGGDVLQLSVPATSLFGKEEGGRHPLQSYARLLSTQGVSPDAVVTELSFDTKAPVPKLFFKPVRYLDEAEYALIQKQAQSEDAKRAIIFTVAQTDNVGQAAAAPIVQQEQQPQTQASDEPAVRAKPAPGKTGAKLTPEQLAATLKEWDDN